MLQKNPAVAIAAEQPEMRAVAGSDSWMRALSHKLMVTKACCQDKVHETRLHPSHKIYPCTVCTDLVVLAPVCRNYKGRDFETTCTGTVSKMAVGLLRRRRRRYSDMVTAVHNFERRCVFSILDSNQLALAMTGPLSIAHTHNAPSATLIS